MPLPDEWGTPDDFATLFQYQWYQDFPIGGRAIGAQRSDWTIHIGIIVRRIADLMGLWARFESGNRTDAVLRSGEGDEIAVEWEWDGVWGNELSKLKTYEVFSQQKDSPRPLRYGVLITYTHTPNIEQVYEHVKNEWEGASCNLLLVLIDLEESKEFFSGKDFKNVNMSIFDRTGQQTMLRSAPAFPWNVKSSRWVS